MAQRKESPMSALMKRVRAGKVTRKDRVTLRRNAARARNARARKGRRR
jgi:hypothetical protein